MQADGIGCAHSESLRRHDYVVLYRSSMIEMTKGSKIGDDLRTPKVSSDGACGGNEVNLYRCAEIELPALNDQDRKLAVEQNYQNKGPQMAVEDVLNEQMKKFTHTDCFVKHRMSEGAAW